MTLAGRIVRGYWFLLGAGLLAEGAGLLVLEALNLYSGDVRHNALHAAWGPGHPCAGHHHRSQLRATQTALVFGAFYAVLAIAGVPTAQPFGLLLGPAENAFHFVVGPLALVLGAWSGAQLAASPPPSISASNASAAPSSTLPPSD